MNTKGETVMIRQMNIFISVVILFFLTACGGGSSNSTTKTQEKVITGYVIDDPVVGATIEVYDDKGDLLVSKENATNEYGKFSISLNNTSSKYFIIKSIDGKINGKSYNFELIKILLSDEIDSEIYITPYSMVVYNLAKSKGEFDDKSIKAIRSYIKNALQISTFDDIPNGFSQLLQKDGINKTINELSNILLSGESSEKFLAIFPNSQLLKPSYQVESSITDQNNSFVIRTNSNESKTVQNTSSIVNAIVTKKETSNVYLFSSNIPDLQKEINEDSTAFSFVQLALNDYTELNSLEKSILYQNIKELPEYDNLKKSIADGIANNIPLIDNTEAYKALETLLQSIKDKNLINISTTGDNITQNRNLLARRAFDVNNKSIRKISNIEVFTYPYFSFKFKDSTADSFKGVVEFESIENPAFVGYGFTTKEQLFEHYQDTFGGFSDTYFIPYTTPINRFPSIESLWNNNKKLEIKTKGIAKNLTFYLNPYQDDTMYPECAYENRCWQNKFVAYNTFGFNNPTINNGIYIFNDIVSVAAGSEKFKKLIQPFVETIIESQKSVEAFTDTFAGLSDLLSILNSLNTVLLNTENNEELSSLHIENYVDVIQLRDSIRTIEAFLSKTEEVIKKLQLPKKEFTHYSVDSIDERDREKLVEAMQSSNFFKAYKLSKELNMSFSDMVRAYFTIALYPKITHGNSYTEYKEYAYDVFMKSDKFSKVTKTLVKLRVYLSLISTKKNKQLTKLLTSIDKKLALVQVKVQTGSDISPLKVMDGFDSFASILDMVNSWANRGFYIDYDKLKKIYTEAGISFLSYVSSLTEDELTKYLSSTLESVKISDKAKKLGKKFLFGADIARESVNFGAFVGSCFANPNVLPYTVTAIKNDKKNKIDFKTRFAMDSIGYAASFALNDEDSSKNIIFAKRDEINQPLLIVAKDHFSFKPSMEIIFPKGILSDYLSNTLFTPYDYVYNFRLYTSRNFEKNRLLLQVKANEPTSSQELAQEPSYFSFLYSYYFGENDAYVKKTNAPERLINSIVQPTNTSIEYIDVYDLISNQDGSSIRVNTYESDYATSYDHIVSLQKEGVYSIAMTTDIAQPFTAYIKEKSVAHNSWSYAFKIIVLQSIGNVDSYLNEYMYYKNGGFAQITLPAMKDNIQNLVAIPYINGEVKYTIKSDTPTTYAIDNADSQDYIYFLKKRSYEYLISNDIELSKEWLDHLVKNGIAVKKKIHQTGYPFQITAFNILNYGSEDTTCIETGYCTFYYRISNIVKEQYDLNKIKIELSFGDGNKKEFDCIDAKCAEQEFEYHYTQTGTYKPELIVYYPDEILSGMYADSVTINSIKYKPEITIDDATIDDQGKVTIQATITDKDEDDDLTCEVEWGDGAIESQMCEIVDGKVNVSHQYDNYTNQTIILTITDYAGGFVVKSDPIRLQSSDQASMLKKTGQTKSYDENGNEVTNGSIKDDGYYQVGVNPVYVRTGDIVTDAVTGLEWQDSEKVVITTKTWEGAKEYCSNLDLDGGGWRLPTVEELMSIVDHTKTNTSTSSIFHYKSSSIYWTTTKVQGSSYYAYAIDFNVGMDKIWEINKDANVRCVRY